MPKVIIYTTPTCIYCHGTKEFFKENNIEYEEKNVAQDREALIEMEEKSGQRGVPVIDIDGTVVVGFNKPALSEMLGIKE